MTVYVDCTLCGDTWPTAKPDLYLKLNLSSGGSFTSPVKKEVCGTQTFNWTVSSKLEVSELSKAKWEIWDEDPTTADDLCVAWTGNFSKVGTFTLSGKMSSKLKYLVSK